MNAAVHDPMLQNWSVVVVLVSDVLLFCTVLAILFQIHQQKVAERNTLLIHKHRLSIDSTTALQPFFLEMFKQPALAQIWERGRADLDKLQGPHEMAQFKWACVYWFEHIAGMHRLVDFDVIREEDLCGWEIAIKDDFTFKRKAGLVHYWNVLSGDFDPRFKSWVMNLAGEDALCKCEVCSGSEGQ